MREDVGSITRHPFGRGTTEVSHLSVDTVIVVCERPWKTSATAAISTRVALSSRVARIWSKSYVLPEALGAKTDPVPSNVHSRASLRILYGMSGVRGACCSCVETEEQL